MRRSFFRSLSVLLRPVEFALSLITGLIILYIVALASNVPQHLLNSWIKTTTSFGQNAHVGKVTGLFPLSFHIDSLKIGQASFQQIGLTFLWSKWAFKGKVRDITLTPSVDSTPAPLTFQDFQSSLRPLESALPHFFLLESLKVENLNDESHHLKASVNLKISRTQGVRIALRGEAPLGCYDVHLHSPVTPVLLRNWTYDVDFTNKQNQWHIDGQLSLNDAHWFWEGRVIDCSLPFLRKAKWTLLGRPEPLWTTIQSILSGEPAPPPTESEVSILAGQLSLPYSPEGSLWHLSFSDHRTLRLACQKKGEEAPLTAPLPSPQTLLDMDDLLLKASLRFDNPWSFDVQLLPAQPSGSSFSVEGTYQTSRLSLSNIKGLWKRQSFSCNNIECDLSSKTVQPTKMKLGACTVTTDNVSWYDDAAPSKFFLSSFPLRNNSVDFGVLSCNGAVSLGKATSTSVQEGKPSKEQPWETTLSFRLQPSSKPSLLKTFGWSMDGKILLTSDRIALTNFQLRTGLRNPNEACLTAHVEARCAARLNNTKAPLIQMGEAFLQCMKGTQSRQDEELRRSISLTGSCRGTLALAALTPFLSTGDRILGIVTTKLDLGGHLQEPELTGTFQLQDGYYENIGNGIVLRDVSINAVGEKDGLRFKTVRLTDGTSLSQKNKDQVFPVNAPPAGYAGGVGRVSFLTNDAERKWSPYLKLNLLCNALQVAYGPMVKGRVTGNLCLAGPIDGLSSQPVVTGDVVIDTMSITISTSEMPLSASEGAWKVYDSTGRQLLKSDPSTSPIAKGPQRFGMDVTLRTGPHVIVTDEGFTCHLKGVMTVKGPMIDPYLVGSLTADPDQTNHYNILGKTMRITKGKIVYDDVHLNDPYLKLLLTISLSGKKVFANLEGRLSSINLSLHSNPAMSQEDILALLLFRQGRNELSSQQHLRIKAVSAQMLKGGPLRMLDTLCRQFRIDSLEFVETQDTTSGETKQSVCFRKSLGNNVNVSVEQDIATKNESTMTVTYSTPIGIDLEAKLSTSKETAGVGAQWRKQY